MQKIERDVRMLKRYAVVSTLGLAIAVIAAFRPQGQATRFTALDVERLNVVTADGKPVVIIAGPGRMPGNIIGGKERTPNGPRPGGLLFYNREGDEAGGLIADNEGSDSSLFAFAQLSIDRFGSDQVAALRYVEQPQGWESGLEVSHFPRGVLYEWHNARDSILSLPPAIRDSSLRVLRNEFMRQGKWEIKRVFVGQTGRTAMIRLNDTRGRTRIRFVVDSLDDARIELLDARGTVVQRIP